jgi:hypothetical protein
MAPRISSPDIPIAVKESSTDDSGKEDISYHARCLSWISTYQYNVLPNLKDGFPGPELIAIPSAS